MPLWNDQDEKVPRLSPGCIAALDWIGWCSVLAESPLWWRREWKVQLGHFDEESESEKFKLDEGWSSPQAENSSPLNNWVCLELTSTRLAVKAQFIVMDFNTMLCRHFCLSVKARLHDGMTGPVTMTTKSQRKVLNRGERLLKAGDSEGPLVIVRVKSQPWASQGNTQRLFSSFLDCLTCYDSLLKKKRAAAWIATQFDCLQIPSLLINMQLLQCYIFVPFSSSLPWQQRRGRD